MLNLKKRSNKLFIAALILILGGLLAGCSLSPNQPPTSVGPAPTLPPVSLPTSTPETETQPTAIPEQPTAAATQVENTPVAQVESLPAPDNAAWQVFMDGFNQPLFLTHAGDDSGRVFVVEKGGRIQIVQAGQKLAQPFLDITGQVNSQASEQGLLGLAFHPNYAENGYFFLYYTDFSGAVVVSRFEVSDNPDTADPASESILLTIAEPYGNHNGGMLAFGPDGYLYIGVGDGGAAGDPQGNAQNSLTMLGKILRLDVDTAEPYANPPGNITDGLPEIWSVGLRNPWRFSFDRALGDLYIGDVGQNQWEEIHLLPNGIAGGTNLGWDYYEGTHAYEGTPPGDVSFVSPILEYSHSGGNCSVTGGYVYRGQTLADWQGVYLFGDYCSGIVWMALPDSTGIWQAVEAFQLSAYIASFGEDQAGELYLVDLNGTIYQLVRQ